MTSRNKYQEANESIMLSEKRKEAILDAVLTTEVAPVRRFSSRFHWAGVGVLAAVALLIVIIPARFRMGSASQSEAPMEAMAVAESAEYDEAEEPVLSDNGSYEAASAMPGIAVLPVPDLMEFEGVQSVRELHNEDGSITLDIDTDTGRIEINICQEDLESTDSDLVIDGVSYYITSEPLLSEEQMERLKEFIVAQIQEEEY
ncbi:MAG: hypothetical protein IJ225_02425 [Solobacterium sp.]|nr:hypothetical protein [Solobacterium sp.]